MRRVLAGCIVALCLTIVVQAVYYDFEQITIDATAGGKGFTAAKITPTNGNPMMTYADCRLRTAEISYLTQPPLVTVVTASVGQLLEPGDRLIFFKREDMQNFRAIRTGATSGQLDCLYKDNP